MLTTSRALIVDRRFFRATTPHFPHLRGVEQPAGMDWADIAGLQQSCDGISIVVAIGLPPEDVPPETDANVHERLGGQVLDWNAVGSSAGKNAARQSVNKTC